MSDGPRRLRVLFVCTHNSARSQMAEGFLRAMAGGRFDVKSAGTERTAVHPLAIQVMAERGIDISRHRSNLLAGLMREPWDYVVTVRGRRERTVSPVSGSREAVALVLRGPLPGGGQRRRAS